MGPEEKFNVEPGRVFMVPAAAEAITELQSFSWGDDSGCKEGLEGGLQGWPDGARADITHHGDWEFTMEFSGELSDGLMALLMGMTLEEWQDLKQWAVESRWLQRLTGLNWGHFE